MKKQRRTTAHLPVYNGVRQEIEASVVKGHECCMQNIGIKTNNPELCMICYAIDAFQNNTKHKYKHALRILAGNTHLKENKPDSSNFWLSSSSSWQQKHSSAEDMASQFPQTHQALEPIRVWFTSSSPSSSSSSSCESTGSSPGGYVGSKRNGWTLIISTKNNIK